ncbi:LOW QUALITY PROTEIN: hypothetical protein DH2020_035894 [Rehmannia glutinosa]|uniref:Uncharacterized protein n=1 Tax=Rehmannia glutinosa TaxID=99300 RepID=A0ABR0V584_REHGL
MGTEVLPPQDLLADRFRAPPASFHRRRNFPGNGNLTNLIVNRKPNNYTKDLSQTRQEKIQRHGGYRWNEEGSHGGAAETRRKDDGLAMGQVTLLRRGESLDSFTSKIKGGNAKAKSPKPKPVDDMAVLGIQRIGPASPEMVPKQIRLSPPSLPDVYAGSAFSLSPSPRSLPLPSFFNKKHQIDGESKPLDNTATRDLRHTGVLFNTPCPCFVRSFQPIWFGTKNRRIEDYPCFRKRKR